MGVAIEDLIRVSECYGKLFSAEQAACKRCEACFTCERETQQYLETQPNTPPEWATVAVPGYEDNMPLFRKLSLEELEDLVRSFGDDVSQFDRYEHPKIRRLHLTAELKRHYAKGDTNAVSGS